MLAERIVHWTESPTDGAGGIYESCQIEQVVLFTGLSEEEVRALRQ